MTADNYWTSTRGLLHRHRWRERHRVLVHVSQEPEQKGPRGRRGAQAFRTAVRDQMRRTPPPPWPRAKVAVELRFTTTRPQPPRIERLAKHYLDLLDSGAAHSGATGGPLLFNDDCQVKMLAVSCHHNWDPNEPVSQPGIWIDCQTRSDAAAELEASGELELVHDDPRGVTEQEHADPNAADLTLGDSRSFEDSADPTLRRMAADIRFDALRQRQEAFLRGCDAWLTYRLRTRARELLTGRKSQLTGLEDEVDAASETASMLTSVRGDDDAIDRYMRIRLPPLPMHRGQREQFVQDLKVSCQQFITAYPMLSPLVVPLRVTILVVPPSDEDDRDLDNIALHVIPVVNQQFRPPLIPEALEPTDVDLGRGLRPTRSRKRLERAKARARSLHRHSVWAYQVLELHRRPDDPPEGALELILGHGYASRSVWREAARLVGRFADSRH